VKIAVKARQFLRKQIWKNTDISGVVIVIFGSVQKANSGNGYFASASLDVIKCFPKN